MPQHYYPLGSRDYPRQPDRVALPASRREPSRTCPIAHGQRNHDPGTPPETESDRGGGQSRRRIAVACSRCRKRKIKCSGDPGDGGGCQNCKNANTGPGVCQFLRVNSGSLVCAPQMSPEWPYLVVGGSSGIPQLGNTQGQYASNNIGSLSSSATASFTGMAPVSRAHHSNSGASNSYAPLNSRQDHNLTYGGSQGDASFDAFGYTPAQYPTQSHDTHGATVPYGTQEFPRNWPASNRWTPIGSFEQDYSARYATSSYPYANASVGPTLDGNSLFPTMSSLASSLPASMSSDRLLPHPRDSMVPQSIDRFMGINQGVLGDSSSYMPSQASNSKATIPWFQERVTTGGSQNPVGTVLGSNAHLVRETRSKSSSSASESQETPFGYVVPLQHSPPRASSPLVTEYTPTSSASSNMALENQLYPGKPSYMADSPSNLISGHNASSSNLYTYSTGNSANRNSQSSGSGGTLSSGQPYTQLRQSQPQSGIQLENLRQNSIDRSSRISHRPTVSNANTTRR